MFHRSPRHIVLATVWAISVTCRGGGSGDSGTTAPVASTPAPLTPAADTTPLRTYASKRNLLIGAAIDRGFRYAGSDGAVFRSKMAREFNVLTPENDMKFDHLHPSRTVYRFDSADSLVAYAQANGMKVRGHTLAWYSQLPSWISSGNWSSDSAKVLLNEHVTTVVNHYKGQILEWDVVNEALNDDGSMRSGFWYDRLGSAYIEQAFRAARAADPDAGLFYNDYNIEGLGAKSDSAYALISNLVKKGVPISGVGFQAHFIVGGVPSTLGANIARFAALGIKVHITELDLRMTLPSTPALLDTQAQNYRDIVQTCASFPACDVIVMWGFSDKESWIPSAFPGQGAALIFDGSYLPKPAYTSLQSLLK
jgi:endo-1,4-beta-xylanase